MFTKHAFPYSITNMNQTLKLNPFENRYSFFFIGLTNKQMEIAQFVGNERLK